jgi:hypothetical protein
MSISEAEIQKTWFLLMKWVELAKYDAYGIEFEGAN